MPTFDGDNLIVTLDSGVTEVDVREDLYEAWKDWLLGNNSNMKYPQLFRPVGGDPLTGELKAGTYFFWNNVAGWRLRPPEEDITTYLTGSLVAESTDLPIFIPTIGAFTAAIIGLQPVTQLATSGGGLSAGELATLERLNYMEAGVWIDTELVPAGDGSQASPFNTLTAAVDYAEAEGIKTLYVYADITLDRQLKNFKVIGVGTPTIDANGQDLTKSEFWHCKMQGNYIGVIIVQESVLLGGFYLNGFFEKNGLAGDLICVDGASVFMKDNASAIAGLGRPTVSMNATGWCNLSVRGNEGGLTLKDCNNVLDEVTVEVAEGSLTFDSSNTTTVANSMIARGMCKFVNEVPTAGVVIDETGYPANINIADSILRNKTETNPVTGIMTVFARDNVTPLFTANIWENIAATDPYAGNAVNRRDRLE